MKTYPILEGKTVIVTGAAMGMGEATAKLFAEAKANVVVADFNDEKGNAVTDAINDSGGSASFVHVDVSKSDEVQAMVRFAADTYGRLDGAVNNAALTPDNGAVAEFDEDYWERLMAVDLKGAALCMKYEIQQFLEQGDGGSIVNISSVSGFRPQPGNIAYVSAKHGVVGMTKVAAMEYGKHNIRVNSVAPGAIDTPMLRGALEEFGLDE
ncbi:MAG: SDR family oxidoreductase, partial [bacterium]|nr:SDR family oxidoreductase [bacterium]